MGNETESDPIDALIPRPRPWWVRLAVGFIVIAIVGAGAWLWGFGFLYPSPECCGSGGGSATMALTEDGKAVKVAARLYNSSGRALAIDAASAELPGATVQNITVADDNYPFLLAPTHALPATVSGTESRLLVITFVPVTCQDDGKPWGTVTVGLDVVNGWLPSVHRTYRLPNPVVDSEQSSLSVFMPETPNRSMPSTPLAAACALLDRTS